MDSPAPDTTDGNPDPLHEDNKTDFGFERVSPKEKTARVADVFHSVAPRYDCMNDVMSLGLHRYWKHYAIAISYIRPHHTILDLAGGTGDLTLRLVKTPAEQRGPIYLTDINPAMLSVARDRLLNQGKLNGIHIVQADAESLPFEENKFDRILIGFGLRNVTDKHRALAEMHRVLRPGGIATVLEFSHPASTLLQKAYDLYSFQMIPRWGKWIAHDENSYRYLVESIRRHPTQSTLKTWMEDAGFAHCDFHNLSGGIVAVHRGYKE